MKVIDLRSDTLTMPTAEMLSKIATAKVGDDGRSNGFKGEDITVIELEHLAADNFGMEDALFVPSGVMGNIVSLLSHANRGNSIVVSDSIHLYKSEKGIFNKDLFGLIPLLVPQTRGMYDLDVLEKTLKSGKASAVCIENPNNIEGGTVITKLQTKKLVDLCHLYNTPIHLDGARIFNAAATLNIDVKELTKGISSVMFCLSKGLGSPVGSMVVGNKKFIKKAREYRTMIGGQMRQVGIIAAPGIVSMEKMIDRLHTDNRLAKKLANGLSHINGLNIDLSTVQTNIVKINLNFINIQTKDFIDQLYSKYKVRGNLMPEGSLRFVVYNAISEEDIDEAIIRIERFCHNLEVNQL